MTVLWRKDVRFGVVVIGVVGFVLILCASLCFTTIAFLAEREVEVVTM